MFPTISNLSFNVYTVRKTSYKLTVIYLTLSSGYAYHLAALKSVTVLKTNCCLIMNFM